MPKKPQQQLAKLSRPRLYDALPRERLFALLDEKRRHPVVWVSGPPGAGKTTLLASYWHEQNLHGIWYHVDAGDSDLSTFFYYLTEAARALAPKQRPLPLLTPEYLPDVTGFARRYFRALFGRMREGSLLVFDNFQDAPQDGLFAQVFDQAIAELPGHINLVCASRTEAPAEFSKHVAAEALVTLGWEDLRLTLEETRAIATARGVETGLAPALHERSEGWAAGLTLTIEHLRRHGAAAIPGPATHDATFDYFAAQIFDSAGARDRDTLLRTSVFTTFTAEIAVAVSANPDATTLLDRLCRRQLFTYRRSGDESRYQYHDLFRAFLRRVLQKSLSPEQVAGLKVQAAHLLLERNAAEAAFPLFVEARQWDEAARLIGVVGPQLLAQGRWQTLRDWIETLPGSHVVADAWLQYWLGCARVYQGMSAAREQFEAAFGRFRSAGEVIGQLLAAAWIIRTHYMEYSNFQPLDRWAGEIASLLDGRTDFADPAHEIHVLGALVIVFTYRQPGHPMSARVIARLTELLGTDVDVNQRVGAATGLMIYHILAMEPANAQRIIDLIGPQLEREEVTPHNQAWWWLFVGYHHHRAEERRLPVEALERSDRIAAANGLRQTEFYSRCFRTYYAVPWREFAVGRAAIAALEGTFTDEQPMNMAQFHLATYFIAVSTGDTAGAVHHARIAVEATTRLGAPFFYVAWRAQAAVGPALAGDIDLAQRWLDEAWAASEANYTERYRPTILQARAFCAMLSGDRARARMLLAKSIATGKTFNAWPYGRGVVPLFDWLVREALEAEIEVPFIRAYIRKHEMLPPPEDISNWPWAVRVFTLGEFRIEVDGEPLVFSRKAPKRTLALLKAIIAFGGAAVPEQKLVDALWPDEDVNSARESLAVSLHRLRKLLVHSDAVQLVEGQISLDPSICWVDAWGFERATSESERQPEKSAAADPVWEIYRGHFLAEEIDAPWALSTRERLRAQFLRYVSNAGRRHESDGKLDVAVLLYQKGIEADDLAEELYQGLMRCHMRLDRRAEGMAAYRRLRQTLSVTLGISPSAQSEKLFKSLKGD